MNFNAPLFKAIRLLFFPFSIIYGLIIWCRNKCYDLSIFRSVKFRLPVICVGNLSVGGTGKSPMIEYLLKLAGNKYKTATVSRGYKRTTKGVVIADNLSTAEAIGDEPMQFFNKFANATIVVGEKRAEAISQLLELRPGTEMILLDDAFQHRAVTAGLNILLTDFHHRYTRDLLLPAGNLRDEKRSARRADIIIVTKCPHDLSTKSRGQVLTELKALPEQKVYFTSIAYAEPYRLSNGEPVSMNIAHTILLVTGIADPAPLVQHLGNKHKIEALRYPDHHVFSQNDISKISAAFSALKGPKIILTTEKDATRLMAFQNELRELPVCVIPITCSFLFDEGKRFNNIIVTFIERFKHQITKINE
jgi:tetraacyldisaccharide 4'-kinase